MTILDRVGEGISKSHFPNRNLFKLTYIFHTVHQKMYVTQT